VSPASEHRRVVHEGSQLLGTDRPEWKGALIHSRPGWRSVMFGRSSSERSSVVSPIGADDHDDLLPSWLGAANVSPGGAEDFFPGLRLRTPEFLNDYGLGGEGECSRNDYALQQSFYCESSNFVLRTAGRSVRYAQSGAITWSSFRLTPGVFAPLGLFV